MKDPTRSNPRDATASLHRRQFDGLIIIYLDAEGLKRGFQLWLGWPGGPDRLRNCVPIYFGRDVARLEPHDGHRAGRGDTLVLLCLPRDGAFSSRNIGTLAEVLERGGTERRGLIVLFSTHRGCANWRRRWPLPGSLKFPLGSYTVSPFPHPSDNEEYSGRPGYVLRIVSSSADLERAGA